MNRLQASTILRFPFFQSVRFPIHATAADEKARGPVHHHPAGVKSAPATAKIAGRV